VKRWLEPAEVGQEEMVKLGVQTNWRMIIPIFSGG